MKKVFLLSIVLFLFAPLARPTFAQSDVKVATVRHINWLGAPKRNDSQRLIISKPGEEVKIIPLEQRYIDDGMNDQIDSDNRIINEEFTKLYKEGYELETSSSSNFSFQDSGNVFQGGNPTGGREIIYIFIKE